MAAQRRNKDLVLLLGDSDALANACYDPILDYARGRDLPVLHDEVATLLGDEDLAAIVGPVPHLAPIVLPPAWATEVAWWPALAHEVGHCFYRSVEGLDAELRRTLQLPPAGAQLSPHQVTAREIEVAFGRWLEEIFCDAFGVMMLGPALVRSGMWLLGSPQQPQLVSVCQLGGQPLVLDEHPPPHLRVLLSCWLLSEMGYPDEADRYEATWRKLHGSPAGFFFPLPGGRWGTIEESVLLSRGVGIVQQLYEGQLKALDDEALRSVPGLDFGPHEHEAALEAAQILATGYRASTRDPRCLIAGATLARFSRPASAAQIFTAARATIPAVGVSRRRLRARVEQEDAAEELRDRRELIDEGLLADAVLLDAILNPPPGRLHRGPG